jgi:small-conductance mechanosensitive channel
MADGVLQLLGLAWPLLAALLLGLVVRRALLALSRRARARPSQRLRARVLQVIVAPLALALPLLFLAVAVATTPLPPAWSGAVQHLLGIAGILCVTWLLVRVVGALERRVLRRHPVDVPDNLAARRAQTQTRVIGGAIQGAIVLVGVAIALMTFPQVRQIGATLLASAGVIGLVAGIAAKPVFGNLIAGLQIAIMQPIRFDDVVIVEGEWGRIEEITAAYVVVRIWDERRMIVPLQWFIEHPFENWTRTTSQLLGTTFLWLDYTVPMAPLREELERICRSDPRWDGRVCIAQVTDNDHAAMQVRLLVSARNSGDLFDLRCVVRERMVSFVAARFPEALPRVRRMDVERPERAPAPQAPVPATQTSSPGAEDVNAADPQAARSDAGAPTDG